MTKKILLAVAILGIMGLSYGLYEYFRPNPGMASLASDMTLTATDLYAMYESDEARANTQYLDKVIEISGSIRDISVNNQGLTSITLDTESVLSGVICELEQGAAHRTFKEGAGKYYEPSGVPMFTNWVSPFYVIQLSREPSVTQASILAISQSNNLLPPLGIGEKPASCRITPNKVLLSTRDLTCVWVSKTTPPKAFD